MRKVYRVLAAVLMLEVVVQSSAAVFGVAGLGNWVANDGGTLDEAAFDKIFEGDITFTGAAGMMIHGMNGMMIIPIIALVLLIVSFFAKVPRGSLLALAVVLLVALQIVLGIMGHENAYFGMLHGINAFILFGAAMAAFRASAAPVDSAQPERPTEAAAV